jgi:DNA polymerase-3 subunit gamma/tau
MQFSSFFDALRYCEFYSKFYSEFMSITSSTQEESQEQYIVTARKWRPQRFSDVVGQEHVSRTLRNAVQSNRIHHAYIFNGPRGVGKTTTARILAKAVNCENIGADFEPCNACASCVEINTGRSLDVIEIDGASNNSVDDVRKLRENAKYPPVKGRYKMYIIDEVHMLSTSAFNALLKTLEEPPRHLLFVFATTEPHKVPATILSRCQRFDFRRMQIDEIVAQLRYIAGREGIEIDDESLAVIGKKGDGSMRDSQSIFDQVIAFCGKNVEYGRVNEALNLIDAEFYFTLGTAIRTHDVAQILHISREVFMRGYDLQECLHGLAEHFRNILTVLATGGTNLIEASKVHREQYLAESANFAQADVLQYMTIITQTEQALRFAPQPRLRFEFALVQMAKMDSAVQISELLQELAELKKKVERGEIRTYSADTESRASIEGRRNPQRRESVVENFVEKKDFSREQSLEKKDSNGFATAKEGVVENSVEKIGKRGEKLETILIAPKPEDESEEEPENEPQRSSLPTSPSAQTNGVRSPSEALSSGASSFEPDAERRAAPCVKPSASELEASWRLMMSRSKTLNPTAKAYLLQSEMVTAECDEGEIRLWANEEFIADSLRNKQTHIGEVFLKEFGLDVRVVVQGGSDTASLFDAVIETTATEGNILQGSTLQDKTVEGAAFQNKKFADTAAASSSSAFPSVRNQTRAAAPPQELPELDKAIVELFDAQAVPLR